MVTTAPPNGGGFITASFPVNGRAEKYTVRHLTAASTARASTCSKHILYPGFYATYSKPTAANPDQRGIRPILLPTSFVASSSEDSYLFTVSNLTTEAKLFTAPASEINGSTIRLVTADFAKTLPDGFAKGTSFKPSTRKIKDIPVLQDMLPTSGSHVFVLCPNTLPIPGGTAFTVKGKVDDAVADAFRELGPVGLPWLQLIGDMDAGVLPFDVNLQSTVVANKIALGVHYPTYVATISITNSPTLTFTAPALDSDDEDEEGEDTVGQATAELRALLAECMRKNTPAAAPSPHTNVPPHIETFDTESMISGANNGAAATNSQATTDRLLAKLRLLCASYQEETDTVTLFELDDKIRQTLALAKKSQAEKFGNHLRATNDALTKSTDCVNHFASWPETYSITQ